MDASLLRSVERWSVGLGVAVVAASLLFGRADVAAGATAGAVLGVGNLFALRRLGEALARKRQARLAAVLLPAKMLVLMGLIWAALRYLPIHPIAFLCGISVFVAAILLAGVRAALGPHGAGADWS